MPKVAENLFAKATKPGSQSLTRNAPKVDGGESFEKALQRAKPKPQLKPEQPPPADSKSVKMRHAPEDAPPDETTSQQSQTVSFTTEQAGLEPQAEKNGEPVAGDSASKQDEKPEADQTAVDPALVQQSLPAQAMPTVPTDCPQEQQSDSAKVVSPRLVQTPGDSDIGQTAPSPDAAQSDDSAGESQPDAPSPPSTVKQPAGKQASPVRPVSPPAENAVPAEEPRAVLKAPQPAPAGSNAELPPAAQLQAASTDEPAPSPLRPVSTPSPLAGPFALPAAKAALSDPTSPQAAPAPPAQSPEIDFAASNHERIISSVRTQLLPNGGTMHIRLDPPELGALLVTVRMADGAMTASFDTSNDQATKLLSHSLGQLKQALESQGVSVERLHVQQSPREQQSNTGSDDQQRHSQPDGQSARQEQHRREMLRRMWRRLGLVQDPLDLVA